MLARADLISAPRPVARARANVVLRVLVAVAVAAIVVYLALYLLVVLFPLIACVLLVCRRIRPSRGRRHSFLRTAAVAAAGSWLGSRGCRKAIREQDALTKREREELIRLRRMFDDQYGQVPF